jgi:Mrp family chromosome partitioning ATPase
MQQMLQDLSQRFDRIVIDTPPVISVADSLALTHIADSTVLVVRSGVSRRKAVRRGRDLLNRAKSHLVGIVFNCVNLKLENYNYARGSYYSKKMNSYYGEDHKEQD